MSNPIIADAGDPLGSAAAVPAAVEAGGPAPAAVPARRRRLAALPWRCIAAWTVALLIPALLVLAIALPWWQRLQMLDADHARGLDQLARYQRLVATLPSLRAELASEQANDEFKAFYFDAETPALAGARLQSEVQEMVRSAGARPISTQILPVDEDEQPPRVRIRTQLQGTTDELLDLLYRIESARPFLFVDQMSIRSTSPRRSNVRRRVSRRGVNREVGQLTVRLDIFGYILGGSA
ncbi:type II secretion system protein GspM [uncultured Thiohalocapsa sp.]|uniref:type II secretion system protein GspM n=1 Tax=uncultured Thiohalocapsa sp. TaxID=768990 RepID=UPI0025DEB425|nr:type II secretion system protein GspM [uncultured Thiohalocapsa sp.]